ADDDAQHQRSHDQHALDAHGTDISQWPPRTEMATRGSRGPSSRPRAPAAAPRGRPRRPRAPRPRQGASGSGLALREVRLGRQRRQIVDEADVASDELRAARLARAGQLLAEGEGRHVPAQALRDEGLLDELRHQLLLALELEQHLALADVARGVDLQAALGLPVAPGLVEVLEAEADRIPLRVAALAGTLRVILIVALAGRAPARRGLPELRDVRRDRGHHVAEQPLEHPHA